MTTDRFNLTLPRRLRWIISYVVARSGALTLVLLTNLLRVGLEVLKPVPMKVLLDNILDAKPLPLALERLLQRFAISTDAYTLLGWTIAATIAIFLLTWTLDIVSELANISFGHRMVYDLASDVFSHLQRLSLRFHASNTVGDSMRRVTEDCGAIAVIVKDGLLPVFSASVSLVLMFIILWNIDPTLTLLSLIVIPFMGWVFKRYARPMLLRSYEQSEAEARLYAVSEQTLSAVPVIQAFNREADADFRFRRTTEEIIAATLAATRIQLTFGLLISLATAAGTAAILWIGGMHAISGALGVGGVVMFLSYLGSLYAPVAALMQTGSTFQGASASIDRVLEILLKEREPADLPGARDLDAAKGHVRIENATFGYQTDRPVLREVNFEALPGQTIAIVGPTGAGKSTLASLVPRFFDPWTGRVLLDETDLRELKIASLRRHISVVLQEPFLFPITIGENIAYGRPDATRQQILDAARDANALEFIEQLPLGLDTPVGERGVTLSGGQRQRLSIARALLKDAPVLVLDEPTSALDPLTESLLMQAVKRLMQGRTTIVIAHRLSTIRDADRIVVLDEGKVVEQGNHPSLLALDGLYSRMYQRLSQRNDEARNPNLKSQI